MNPGSDPNFMADVEPDPSEVEIQLNEIKHMDISPAIYHVALYAKGFKSGFDCAVTFRTEQNAPASLETHGETPEEALCKMINVLQERFCKCPTCGQYMKG